MTSSRLALLSSPLLLALVAVAGFGSAAAQDDAPMLPPPPASAPPMPAPPSPSVAGVTVTARRPTTVSGVTVVAAGWCPKPDATRYPVDHDPAVVDSFPAQGAATPPGPVLVRITFDEAMSCDWEVSIEGGDSDPCAKAGAWALPARRTFVTRCTLAPATHYVFHFRKRDGFGFVGLSGRAAAPFDLIVDTTDARPTPANAPNADPHPQAGEMVKAYVTCVDQGGEDETGACQKALIASDGPPDTP